MSNRLFDCHKAMLHLGDGPLTHKEHDTLEAEHADYLVL
jgi:hypothetical protein